MDLVQEFSGMDYGDYAWAFLPQTESPNLNPNRKNWYPIRKT